MTAESGREAEVDASLEMSLDVSWGQEWDRDGGGEWGLGLDLGWGGLGLRMKGEAAFEGEVEDGVE